MKKKADKTLIITTLICLWPVILGVRLYNELPLEIAIHFDSAGNPDNYFSKPLAVFGLPAILAAINLFVHFRVNSDPKRKNISPVLKIIYKWAMPVLVTIIMPVTFYKAMGSEIPVGLIGTGMAGLLILLCGNYLPKCKKNYTVGIKLPWTLDNDENWYKTHRFAGAVWVIGGIIFTVNAFFSAVWIMLSVIILLLVLPVAYSYLLYIKQQAEESR